MGRIFVVRGFLVDVFFPGSWESFVSLLNGEGGFGWLEGDGKGRGVWWLCCFWWLGEFPVPFEWKGGFWVAGGRWQGAWGRGFSLRGGGGFWKGFLKNRGWGVFDVRGFINTLCGL